MLASLEYFAIYKDRKIIKRHLADNRSFHKYYQNFWTIKFKHAKLPIIWIKRRKYGRQLFFKKMQNSPQVKKGKKKESLVCFNGALLVFFPHIYFSHFFSHMGIGKELGKTPVASAAGLFYPFQKFKSYL